MLNAFNLCALALAVPCSFLSHSACNRIYFFSLLFARCTFVRTANFISLRNIQLLLPNLICVRTCRVCVWIFLIYCTFSVCWCLFCLCLCHERAKKRLFYGNKSLLKSSSITICKWHEQFHWTPLIVVCFISHSVTSSLCHHRLRRCVAAVAGSDGGSRRGGGGYNTSNNNANTGSGDSDYGCGWTVVISFARYC